MKNFANDGGLSVSHKKYQANSKLLIKQKMKILKEFYIVDKSNEAAIREYLEKAVEDRPNNDPQVVLDQAASRLIKQKLKDI